MLVTLSPDKLCVPDGCDRCALVCYVTVDGNGLTVWLSCNVLVAISKLLDAGRG